MDKILAIIGGMGPKASLLLHTQLLAEMPKYLKIENDQEFLNIIHLSMSEDIVDRMSYLLGSEGVNPAKEIFEQIKYLEHISHEKGVEVVTAIPCNTFHARPIYDELLEHMRIADIKGVHLLNLIEETSLELERHMPKGSKVGVLSTTGEWKMHIYDASLSMRGFDVINREESLQSQIQACIYNKEWGLKTASTNYDKSVEEVGKILTQYKKLGAEAIVWGCTEFSLISEEITDPDLKFFDSTKIIADRMIAKAL